MSWSNGNQPERKRRTSNEELAQVEGFLEEKDAKLWLEKFFRENLTFLSKVLTGVELLEFQSLMIKAMFNVDYFLAICSRGSGKSFICAIFLILYASLNQGVKIGIIANSFRQARLLMQKILDLRLDPKAKFLRQIISDKDISLKNDEWVIRIGRSQLVCLPTGDGGKLRGYRFKVMVIDELLLLPSKLINEVIRPFLSTNTDVTDRKKVREAETALISQGKLLDEDRIKWGNNKMIGLSSASYSFEYLKTMYDEYEAAIFDNKREDNAKYGVFHISYECLPVELYDQALIASAKAQMSEAQFGREFLSRFTDDSSGYYKMSKMKACTYPDGEGQCIEAIGEKGAEYILSGDVSWSESEGSDDFVFQVIKYFPETGIGVLVHSYALPGMAMKDHIRYLHFLLKNFNIKFIVLDFAGGVQFLSAANESELFKSERIEIKTIDVDVEDSTKYNEDIQSIRNIYNFEEKRICIQRKPSSNFIRQGNELLQAAIDHRRIWFAGAATDDEFERQIKLPIPVDSLKFLRDNSTLKPNIVDFVENLKFNVEMTKTQCALIEVTSTAQGTQTFDLPPNLKKQRGANKARRDSFTALMLGNWGVSIFRDMLLMPVESVQSTFTPILI
jgi:hypothetical protein